MPIHPDEFEKAKGLLDSLHLIYQTPQWSILNLLKPKQISSQTSSDLFFNLCEFRFLASQKESHLCSLVSLRNENFILQPMAIYNQPNCDPQEGFSFGLKAADLHANQRLCEEIVIVIPRIASALEKPVLSHGFQKIEKESQVFKLWRVQTVKKDLEEYNVFSKKIRKTVFFD